MIEIINTLSGLSFQDWTDALTRLKDNTVVSNFFLSDHLTNAEKYWLQWLLYPGPLEIQLARGIGDWKNPTFLILTNSLSSRLTRGDPRWHVFPKRRRLRPFNESLLKLKEWLVLTNGTMIQSGNSYVTAMTKNWLSEFDAYFTFLNELKTINISITRFIICLPGTLELFNKFVDITEETLKTELKKKKIISLIKWPKGAWERDIFRGRIASAWNEERQSKNS